MKSETFTFKGIGDMDIFTYKWSPEDENKIKGVVQIAHGMSESAERYESVAKELTEAGYIVYGDDHRGHGQTAKEIDSLGCLNEDCFNLMVEDIYKLSKIIRDENPNLPIFLLGHSMGSFLTQRFICLYGDKLSGTILSGSNGSQGIIADIGRIVARREIKKLGRDKKSTLMSRLSFGGFNRAFKPNRTEFDWLSRDEKEVDKYIENPYCGYIYNTGFYYDLLGGLKLIARKEEVNKIPKDLPIYIFSGDKDPVGNFGKGVLKLVNLYKSVGIEDLEYKLYKDGRHEMFNEINKEEVVKDLIVWLDKHIN
ncbi:alpha/beta hydrolase [Clostridium sp. JNZ J1-5]